MRYGIVSLAAIIEKKSGKKLHVPDTLYLFWGRRTDRIKGLVWYLPPMKAKYVNAIPLYRQKQDFGRCSIPVIRDETAH